MESARMLSGLALIIVILMEVVSGLPFSNKLTDKVPQHFVMSNIDGSRRTPVYRRLRRDDNSGVTRTVICTNIRLAGRPLPRYCKGRRQPDPSGSGVVVVTSY